MVFMATLAMAILGLLLTKPLLLVLRVRREVMMPIIFVLCTIGAFAIASRLFDVWVMLFFGIVGFALRELRFPMAPLILGIVLGDILDKSLRRGLVLSDGDLTPFFTRPISAIIWISAFAFILFSMPSVRRWVRGRFKQRSDDELSRKTTDTTNYFSPHADTIASFILVVFAGGILIESLRMERLSHLNINPFTAPGVVPGLVSVLLLASSGAMLIRSIRRGGLVGISQLHLNFSLQDASVQRVVLTLGLTLSFALGLLGNMPFGLAASIFVFAFLLIMDRNTLPSVSDIKAAPLVRAASIALIAGYGVSTLFSEVFLVRLP